MNKPMCIQKLKTGIAGFDWIGNGGLPMGRATLVAGTAGSSKTIFAIQFLVEGVVKNGEPAVFVTLRCSRMRRRSEWLTLPGQESCER